MRVRLPGTIFSTFFLPFAFVICFAAGPGFVLAGDVHLVTYDGPITPVAAEFLVQSINAAESEGAAALVIQLDTPGGLDTSMRDIIKAMLNSTIPKRITISSGKIIANSTAAAPS